jgi:hypothetical protein
LLAVGILWAVACAGWIRYPQKPSFSFALSDWRITLGKTLVREAEKRIRAHWSAGSRRIHAGRARLLAPVRYGPGPGKRPDLLAVTFGSIGVPGYTAGRQVFVIDLGGLAEPLAARTSPTGQLSGIASRSTSHGTTRSSAQIKATRRSLLHDRPCRASPLPA